MVPAVEAGVVVVVVEAGVVVVSMEAGVVVVVREAVAEVVVVVVLGVVVKMVLGVSVAAVVPVPWSVKSFMPTPSVAAIRMLPKLATMSARRRRTEKEHFITSWYVKRDLIALNRRHM